MLNLGGVLVWMLMKAGILFGAVGVMVVAEVEMMFLVIASAKIPERKGSISPSSFYGNCPTISYTFFVLFTQWVSSP